LAAVEDLPEASGFIWPKFLEELRIYWEVG